MAAAIAFQQARTQSGSSSSRTLSFTAASAAGQERLVALVAISSAFATTTFGSVTVDGQAATQVGPYVAIGDSGGPNGPIVSFWRAAGTSATTVVVNFNVTAGSVFDARGVLWSLSNAGTLLANQPASLGGGSVTGDLALNLNTATGGAVAAVFMAYNSTSHAASWVGVTERYDGTADSEYGQDWFGAADLNVVTGSTPLTVTADLPNDFTTGLQGAAGLAVSFNPAPSGVTLTAAAGSYTLTGSSASDKYVMPLGAAGA